MIVIWRMLKETLTSSISVQPTCHDALDESPNRLGYTLAKGTSACEELVEICVPNLRICVTSRPEIDIRKVLEFLTLAECPSRQSGQKEDIADYVRSIVYSGSEKS